MSRADRPIAVEFRLRPIEGLEFVEETVTALGSSTELAHHLFRESLASGWCSRELTGRFWQLADYTNRV
jgi:hypothetical protein